MNHHETVIALLKFYYPYIAFTGIEIGTAEGLLTKSLLLYIPNLTKLYTIDPYLFIQGGHFEAGVGNQEWHNDRKRQADVALEIYKDRCVQLHMTSNQAVDETPDKVDFVWIDGDHSQEQIYLDVKNYYPKVISGGIFGGHDWNHTINIVKSELKENVMLGDDLTWWAIKQ